MARAITRGLAVGVLFAMLARSLDLSPLQGFLWGLVAAPLAWVEAWGERRERRYSATLLAWTLALAWPPIGYLHGVYIQALHPDGDMTAAFELVRRAAHDLLPPGDHLRVGVGFPFALSTTGLFAWPVALRLAGRDACVVFVPAVASCVTLCALTRFGFFTAVSIMSVVFILGLLLLALHLVTDGAVDRVMDRGSHVDGAPDG